MSVVIRRVLMIALTVALAQSLGGCGSPEDKVRDYVKSARELSAEGDRQKATVQLRNALKLDPRNTEAHTLMVEFAESAREWRLMYAHLQQLLNIDKNNVGAHLKLAKLLMLSGEIAKATEEVKILEGLAPQNGRVLMLRGLLLARQGDSAGALEHARRAYEADGADVDIVVSYAAALLGAGDSARALELIDKGLQANPDDASLRGLRFQVFANQSKTTEAAAELRKLALSQPDNLRFWRVLAMYHTRNGEAAEAEAVLREAVEKNPQDVNAKLMLASYLGQRDQQQAIDALKTFIASDVGASGQELKFALAEFYIQRDALGEAVDVYRDIATSATSTDQQLSAKNQLARIALQKEDKGEAAALIAEILVADPKNADALIARALVAVSERRTEDAITDLRVALRERPKADNAMVLLATAYLQNSATELAEESLFQAIETNPLNEQAAIQYARLRVGKKDFAGAQKALDILAQGGERSAQADQMRLSLRLLQKDWSGATKLAGNFSGVANSKAFEKYVLAVTLQGQNRFAESIQYFTEALQEEPKLMAGAAAGVMRSYAADGKDIQGMQWLRALVAKHEENTDLHLLLADELARQKQVPQAEEEYRKVMAKSPRRLEPYRALAALAVKSNDPAAAIATLEQGLKVEPGSVELGLRLAGLAQQTGDIGRAESLYRELLANLPTLDAAANNLAVLVAGDGTDKVRLAEALKIATRFENSEQPWYADTLGWILHQDGKPERAVVVLKRAVDKAPEIALFRYHLGVALHAVNDDQGATKQLEKAESLARDEEIKFDGFDEAVALLARIQKAG